MKKSILKKVRLSAFVTILFFTSCKQEGLPIISDQDAPLVELAEPNDAGDFLSELKRQSYTSWQDFKINLPVSFEERDGQVFLKGEGGKSGGGTCRCVYEITSVALGHPPGFPNTLIEFWSPVACNSNPSTNPCNYFSAVHTDNPPCVTIIDPSCVDVLNPQSSFTGVYSFRCDIPEYSVFPVNFAFVPYDSSISCIAKAIPVSGTIKFKIHCTGEVYERNCQSPTGAWTQYSSDEMSLSIVNGQYSSPVGTNVVMSGCGCVPTLPLLF